MFDVILELQFATILEAEDLDSCEVERMLFLSQPIIEISDTVGLPGARSSVLNDRTCLAVNKA